MKKVLTFLIAMFLLTAKVSAASLCSYQEQSELNNKAANVSVSYEVVEETIGTEDFYINGYFKISIVNVSEDFYVVIKNDYNNDKKTYNASDAKDGIISFNWTYADNLTNFTIQVFSTDKTNCPNEKFKTFYLTTPRYNEYSDRAICLEKEDFYLCQKYVSFSKIDDDKFVEQMSKYLNGEVDNKGEEQKNPSETTITDIIFKFIDDYKWFILGGLLIITLSGVVIHKVKTKKQRELGL